MCGIYHIGRELDNGIESLMKMVNRERKNRNGALRQDGESREHAAWTWGNTAAGSSPRFQERDIRPTELAPVLSDGEDGLTLRSIRWGLPGFQKGQVIFNARCETALDKGMFREGVLHGRIVIPAVSFYEWNRLKEKNTFSRPDGKILYMAGFCKGEGSAERFTILTTAANESMLPVHDRMPLILEESEIEPWLYREDWTESILRKIPGPLSRQAEYEQLSLF